MTRAEATTVLATAALLVAGCSRLPGDLHPTDADVARARRVWSDPWLAPERIEVPEARWGSDGQVNRTAARRTTTYLGTGTVPAVAQEVRAATAAGWTLVGATCGDAEVRAVLTRGGTDLDTATAAQVQAPVADPGDERVDVDVQAVVPHHLDLDWPDLGPAVPLDGTCLAGRSSGSDAALPDQEPRGPVDDDVDVPEWSEDGLADADRARLDALAADLWYAGLGEPAPDADPAAGDARRRAPLATGILTPGPRSAAAAVAAVVADMDGWLLTYASCSPPTGTVATLRLDGDAGPVVARLASSAGDAGEVGWTVRLPVVGGPDQGWVDDVPALPTSRCLDGVTEGPDPVVEGTPVALLEELQAMR